MATAVLDPPAEGLFYLNVSWQTYKSIVADHENSSSPRFTYDQGRLEIFVPSPEHAMVTSAVETLIWCFAEEMELDFECTRCSTFYRDDLEKGLEADSSYYFQNAVLVRGKKRIDLRKDPPPELAIEVDVTHSSMNKFSIYAAIGMRELWRYSKNEWKIFTLENNHYVERLESSILPKVMASDLTNLAHSKLELEGPAWMKRVRAWVRGL